MPLWRRTLYTLWLTQFISVAGFSFVMPFIPYYIQELGITDVAQVGLWAGLVTSMHAFSMGILAPVWGALADRHGRKLMILRACFAGAVVLTLMGFVTNVQQLVILRLVQGALTGTIAAVTTLAASVTPKERVGMALGSLQTAVFLGVSCGPLMGGLAGDAFGYRSSFWITGSMLLLSGVLVAFLVHEEFHPARQATGPRGNWRTRLALLGSSALLAVLLARILVRVGSRSLDPVLPLLVQTLLPADAKVGLTTGLISGVSALGAAAGAPLAGACGDRWGHRQALAACVLLAAVAYLPQIFVMQPLHLALCQFVSGLAVGGAVAVLTALLARLTPAGREGLIFGLDASAVSASNAMGPLAGATAAAAFGLRAPFIVGIAAFGAGALAVIGWVRDNRSTADHLAGDPGEGGRV
jgi:DHA1 family multidrug resistance protein-like MFS transporter